MTPRQANIGFSLRNVTISNNTTQKWNLTSSINLTLLESSRMKGEWYCQPAIDGIPVLSSNKLHIGEVSDNASCEGVQVLESKRCAYFLRHNTSVMSSSASMLSSFETLSSSLSRSISFTITSALMLPSLETSSSLLSRSISFTITSTVHDIMPSFTFSYFTSTSMAAPFTSDSFTPTKGNGSTSLVWVYALSALVAIFALIIIILLGIFAAFFAIQRKSKLN